MIFETILIIAAGAACVTGAVIAPRIGESQANAKNKKLKFNYQRQLDLRLMSIPAPKNRGNTEYSITIYERKTRENREFEEALGRKFDFHKYSTATNGRMTNGLAKAIYEISLKEGWLYRPEMLDSAACEFDRRLKYDKNFNPMTYNPP